MLPWFHPNHFHNIFSIPWLMFKVTVIKGRTTGHQPWDQEQGKILISTPLDFDPLEDLTFLDQTSWQYYLYIHEILKVQPSSKERPRRSGCIPKKSNSACEYGLIYYLMLRYITLFFIFWCLVCSYLCQFSIGWADITKKEKWYETKSQNWKT